MELFYEVYLDGVRHTFYDYDHALNLARRNNVVVHKVTSELAYIPCDETSFYYSTYNQNNKSIVFGSTSEAALPGIVKDFVDCDDAKFLRLQKL